MSLTEAAELLGVTQQRLHERIKAHTMLGLMHGRELVIPRAQFVEREGACEVLEGLDDILKVFKLAGEWSVLQFLVEPDPNFGATPFQALLNGQAEGALEAAKAYLDVAED